MKKLFIHIGAPKTGTSAIQSFMLRNRERLARQGVLYPNGGLLKSAHHLIGAAIHPARSKRLGDVSRDEALATAVAQIHDEVAAHTPHSVVISTEYLWGKLSADNIGRLLQPFRDYQLHVVVYLRRQDLLAQSLYVQAVKTGSPLRFAEWVDSATSGSRAGFFFHEILAAWRGSGHPVSVIVRLYEKSQIGTDICADFLDAIGATSVNGMVQDKRSMNSAPDIATTELLRVVNCSLPEKNTAERIRRSIVKHSPPRALFAPLQYFGGSEAAEFMQRFDADNRRVAIEFLGREDGVLFRDPLPESGSAADTQFVSATLLRKLIELLPALTATGEAEAAPIAVQAGKTEDQRIRRKKKKLALARANPTAQDTTR